MRIVIVPPYLGVPNLSHHFPVVVTDVVGLVVVVIAVVTFVVGVVIWVVVVGVDLPQDVRRMAVSIKQLRPSRITFFFILPPFLLAVVLI